MAARGVINAGMLGLQTTRLDKLEVLWIDEEGSGYVGVGFTMQYFKRGIGSLGSGPIASNEERLQANEATLASLDEQKATKFVAVAPLLLDEATFPNQLSQAGPSPAAATAVNIDGEDAYIQFDCRTGVLEFTKD